MSNTSVAILMIAYVASFIGIDIYLATDKARSNTYSARMRAWAKVWPPLRLITAFGMGLVCGHWWWTGNV